jgi:hypothetical protein
MVKIWGGYQELGGAFLALFPKKASQLYLGSKRRGIQPVFYSSLSIIKRSPLVHVGTSWLQFIRNYIEKFIVICFLHFLLGLTLA